MCVNVLFWLCTAAVCLLLPLRSSWELGLRIENEFSIFKNLESHAGSVKPASPLHTKFPPAVSRCSSPSQSGAQRYWYTDTSSRSLLSLVYNSSSIYTDKRRWPGGRTALRVDAYDRLQRGSCVMYCVASVPTIVLLCTRAISILASHQGWPQTETVLGIRGGSNGRDDRPYSFSLTTFSPRGSLSQIEHAMNSAQVSRCSTHTDLKYN